MPALPSVIDGTFHGPGAPQRPEEDPAFLGFMRGAGYSEAEARAEVARRVGALDRQLANGLPEYDDQMRLGIQNIAGGMESRGLLRSSHTLLSEQDFSNQQNRARNRFTQGITDQKADAYGDLARQVADLRRQGAEQSLDARGRLGVDAAQGGLY